MGPERPGRTELRPRRVEEEERRRRPLLDEELPQLEGRGIDPLEILDEDDERLEACGPEQPGGERGEEPPSRHVRRGQHRRVALGDGEIEQGRDERQRLLGIEPRRPERPLERRDAGLRRVLARPGEELPHELRHRVEGRVGEVGLPAHLEPGVGHPGQVLVQHLREARLPDPRLADDEHDLPLPLPRLLEARAEQPPLVFAAD